MELHYRHLFLEHSQTVTRDLSLSFFLLCRTQNLLLDKNLENITTILKVIMNN